MLAAVLTMLAILAHAPAQAQERSPAPSWRTFSVPQSGLTVQIPSGIFSVVEGKAQRGVGQRLASADGDARLAIYSRPNDDGDSPASYLRKNLRTSQSVLSYRRVAPSFFAISTHQEGMIYYSRCNFSDRNAAIHCIDLAYPEAEERAWDPIVTRISLSLRPLER